MGGQLGTEDRPLRVAVVGAGPSGMYAAAALVKQRERSVCVDIFDKLPAPYGLVRYGVAPDHEKMKRVTKAFDKVAMEPNVRFFGNVALGRDLTREELKRHYDQIVYAVGAQADRELGIPGEELEGSTSSTEFVAWYNGHPELSESTFVLSHRRIAVVGIGNVAMDVVRILAKPAEQLASTDIADYALKELQRSPVEDIHVLARRGPAQAACTPTELKELGEIEGLEVVVDPRDLDLDPASARAVEDDRVVAQNIEALRRLADLRPEGPVRRRVHLHFLTSPIEIVGRAGRVAGLLVERNRLEERDDGRLSAVGTGERETLPVTMVIRAIGYRSLPLPGLPYHDRWAVIPNDEGRVIDPDEGTPIPGEYVAGWIKRGPQGLIGTNKADASETAAAMLSDLDRTPPAPESGGDAVVRLLESRDVRYVLFEDWQRIERLEVERGAATGRPRVKFTDLEEMLEALDEPEPPGDPVDHR